LTYTKKKEVFSEFTEI